MRRECIEPHCYLYACEACQPAVGQIDRNRSPLSRMKQLIHRLFISFLLATGPLSLVAAPGPDPDVSAAAPVAPLLERGPVLAAAQAVTAEKYPDAETVLVAEHVRTRYQANGAFEEVNESYTKVLTEEGRRGARSLALAYNAFYGGIRLAAVQTLKPDGRVIDHDPQQISKEQIDRSQASMNIFDPNNKVLEASVPGLEIGDVIRVLIRRWETIPRLNGIFADFSTLESTQPIVQTVREYFGPQTKPLRRKIVLSEVAGTVRHEEKAEGDQWHYLWVGRDIPQIFPENGMPHYATVCQRLLVSTAADWKEVSKWYWNLCQPRMQATSPELEAKARELKSSGTNDEESIRAIFKFVSQEVRYMGITTEKEAPGYEPHDVKTTFANRYGVCRDKAALLVAMLQAAGFEAFPTLVSVGHKLDPEAPAGFFNHAITAVRLPRKGYVFMDSTDEHTVDLLPKYLANQSLLVASPEGESLMTSPIDPPAENMMRVRTEVTLDESGAAKGVSDWKLEGINDAAYRGFFARMKPDEVQRTFEAILKRALPGASLTDLNVQPTDMQDMSQKLHFRLGFTAPSLLVSGGGVAQLDLPYVGSGMGVAGQILTSSLDLDRRRFPLETSYACGLREDLVVHLPPSLENPIALPNYENSDHSDFLVAQSIAREAGPGGARLNAAVELQVRAPMLSPATYLELKRAMARFEQNNRQEAIFQRATASAQPAPAALADTRILVQRYDVRLESADRWRVREEVRKQPLTFAGKKSEAELKIDFNPVWQNARLVSATVTQKDGTVKQVVPEEVNTLDASWVAAAPRYPGAKTLVVSLPGVEIGATIDYVLEHDYSQRPMFTWQQAFATEDRIDRLEVNFDFPADQPLKQRTDFTGHVTVSEQAGRRLVQYRFTELEPVLRETAAPPYFVEFPDLLLSTGEWSDYARAVARAVEPCLKDQTVTAAQARSLTNGIGSTAEQVVAIRDYVAKQIRRAGPSFYELPLERAFSLADIVLRDGYGHGADRAILLCAMLRAIGVSAELVLAARGANGIPEFEERAREFPSHYYYDGLTVRIPPPSPELAPYVLLDTLSQYSALGATELHGKPGLTLNGEHLVFQAPASRLDNLQQEMTLKVNESGDVELEFVQRSYGPNHAEFVQRYREMTPEELKRRQQQLLASLSQNAKAVGGLEIDYRYPGTIRYRAKIDHYAVRTGDTLYFDLPMAPRALVSVDSDRRTRPYLSMSDFDWDISYHITTPLGYRPLLQPEALDWKGPGTLGSFRVTRSALGGKDNAQLDYSFGTHLRPALIPTGSYGQIIELNRKISHPAARRVLLRKDPVKLSGL